MSIETTERHIDAAEIHRTAALMRERAGAATQGTWTSHEEHGRDICDEAWSYVEVRTPAGQSIAATAYPGGPEQTEDPQADAAHIASWPPPVALAVADMLDAIGEHITSHDCEAHCEPGGCDQSKAAVAVVRTYLGESA